MKTIKFVFLLSFILVTVLKCSNNNPKKTPITTTTLDSEVFQLEKEILLDTKSAEMLSITGGVVDSVGNIICIDGVNLQVLCFDSTGSFVGKIGKKGKGPGEFQMPTCIDIDRENRIYIGDHTLRRINIFSRDGHFLDSFIITGPHTSPYIIKVDDQGFLYMGALKENFENPRTGDWIQLYTINGKYLSSFCPTSPVVSGTLFYSYSRCIFDIDQYNNLFVVKETEYKIFKYNNEGKLLATFGKTPLYFKPPSQDMLKVKELKSLQEREKYYTSWTHPYNVIVTESGFVIISTRLFGLIPGVKELHSITVYRTDGQLVADGIRTNYSLLCKDNQNCIYFFLVSQKEDETETSYPEYKIGRFVMKVK